MGETSIKRRASELFVEICELALALGAESIKDLPGCWEHQFDGFHLALNGKSVAAEVSGPGGQRLRIGPYECAIWKEWLLLGVISPAGGVLLQGAEDDLIQAVKAQREDLRIREQV